MEAALSPGDLKELRRTKQEIEALDRFYGKSPIIPKVDPGTGDVAKIDLMELYGDEIKPYLEKAKER